MKRRTALKSGLIISGYTFLVGGTSTMVLSCQSENPIDWEPKFLTEEEIRIIRGAVDRIIPKTDTPGALDAGVDRFIDENISLNFTEEQQTMFREALTSFDQLSRDTFKKSFTDLKGEQQDQILDALHEDSKETEEGEPHLFPVMVDMTKFGYFTSEVGGKEFLVYDPIPGEYSGCIDYSEVGGTWSM